MPRRSRAPTRPCRTMPADSLVLMPEWLDFETAAAVMLKGMTAEYLLHRTFRVRPGDTVLVHAAAGGVGLFLCQWAKALGAKVIGTVSIPAEGRPRTAERLRPSDRLQGLPICFFGQATHRRKGRRRDLRRPGQARPPPRTSRRSRLRGHWVSYGQASGRARFVPGPHREIGHAVAAGAVPLHRRAGDAERDRRQRVPRAAGRHAPRARSVTAIRSPRRPTRTATSRRAAPAAPCCCCPDPWKVQSTVAKR